MCSSVRVGKYQGCGDKDLLGRERWEGQRGTKRKAETLYLMNDNVIVQPRIKKKKIKKKDSSGVGTCEQVESERVGEKRALEPQTLENVFHLSVVKSRLGKCHISSPCGIFTTVHNYEGEGTGMYCADIPNHIGMDKME